MENWQRNSSRATTIAKRITQEPSLSFSKLSKSPQQGRMSKEKTRKGQLNPNKTSMHANQIRKDVDQNLKPFFPSDNPARSPSILHNCNPRPVKEINSV